MNQAVNRKNGVRGGYRPNPLQKVELIEYPSGSCSIRSSHHRINRWVLACESFHHDRASAQKVLDAIEMREFIERNPCVMEREKKRRYNERKAWKRTNQIVFLNHKSAEGFDVIPDKANIRKLVRLGIITPLIEECGKHRLRRG